MFVKFPERENSWTTFIHPFDSCLWFALLLILLLFALTLSITYHLGQEKKINPGSFTLSNNCLVALGAQMGQGSSIEPRSLSTRVAFLPIFILAILIITCYSAKMIAFLTFFKIYQPFDTIEDVLLSDSKVGTRDGGAEQDMFVNTNGGTIFKKIFDEKMSQDPDAFVETLEQGVKKVVNEKFVLVGYELAILEIAYGQCKMLRIPRPISKTNLGVAWAKDLPHGQLFSYFLQNLGEQGILDKLARHYVNKPRSDCGASGEFISMGFTNIISAFVMLLLASVAAVVLCVAECLAKKLLDLLDLKHHSYL